MTQRSPEFVKRCAGRAPFGIHLHADWFLGSPEYFEAFVRFVDTLLADFDDVYFVSGHEVIEWMRQPRTIDEAREFAPWKRSCNVTSSLNVVQPTSAAHTNSQLEVRPLDCSSPSIHYCIISYKLCTIHSLRFVVDLLSTSIYLSTADCTTSPQNVRGDLELQNRSF